MLGRLLFCAILSLFWWAFGNAALGYLLPQDVAMLWGRYGFLPSYCIVYIAVYALLAVHHNRRER